MSQQDDGCYLPVIGSAWRLALADVNGDGARELIYGAYDGAVRCQDLATGDLLWEVATDSFPFGLAAGDADGDGRPEVYAVTADGGLFAIGSGGEPGWTFRSHFPLYDVEVGRLEGEERMQVVCGGIDRKVRVLSPAGELVAEREVERLVLRLALADLDNDGLQEILALDGHDRLLALKLASGRLRTLWTKHMRVPADRRTWHNPALTFSALTLETGDVNGDGSPEILLGSSCHNDHQVLALTAEGDDMWLSAPQRWEFRGETYTEFYSCAMPRVIGGLRGRPGARVLVVTGGSVKVLDASGEILQEANARVGFTDVALDGCTVYLGSSPNGDDAVYRVDLEQDWAGAVEALRRRGVALRVGENLAALREQVLAYEDTPPEGHGPYVIRDLRLRPNERSRRRYESYLAWHRERFPYGNLRYIAQMRAVEETPPLDENGELWSEWQWNQATVHGTMSAEQIVNAARWAEENEVPTVFNVGHGCGPFVRLQTAERMLRAAPNCLYGFVTSEDTVPDTVPRYLKHYFAPLADLCARYDARCTTRNKAAWWMSMPAVPQCYEALFGEGRGEALLMATEDSNSRTSEINALARFGLRQAGLTPGFTVTLLGDMFSFNRYFQWEYPKHGHPYLRLLVAHTLLGGDHYEFRIKHRRRTREGFAFSDIGRESTEIFLHMLGKGLVFAPRPDQMAGLSPLGFAAHEPSRAWLADAHNLHRPMEWEGSPELHNAVIPHNAALWGMSRTPEHALQAVLLEKERQFGHMFATPYGLFVIVPVHADLSAVTGVREWWHTDGVHVWREGGPKLTGPEAAEALRESFEEAAQELPFRALGGVFFQAVRMEEGRYRLYFIESAWVDPQRRDVELRIQLEGECRLRDVLSGESVPVRDGRASFEVPAGSLRILEAEVH